MKALFFICFFILIVLHSTHAQNDTIIHLRELEISSSKEIFNSGLKYYSFDSTLINNSPGQTLSDLLAENNAINLKNYGPGELTTICLRGGSAYHTTVLWNGFTISSPLNGLTDLSLENNFFFDDVNILYGGASALWGSGAVSGSLQLNNRPAFNSGLKIITGISYGSFSNFNHHDRISWGSKKYYGLIKFCTTDNKNNFIIGQLF